MLVIGIAGGTGSGKTTVVRRIMEQFKEKEVAFLSVDSYYYDSSHLPLEERQKINFDHPNSIEFDLLIEHVKQLKRGQPVNEPTYSYLTCTRQPETNRIEPRKVLIIEGILCLANKQLRDEIDLKVFVDCEADLRLGRVIMRDIIERGRDVHKTLARYEATVRPSHIQFIEPTKNYADIIVPQGGENIKAIRLLVHFIKQHL
ncbi:MAG TPA: uridine kinase [Prolixibacteraceae bacterium]|nr:MAG: uridine kinase [Bacteroidetes bacterium GWA2_42_15]HBL78426.1 uridine kinase [Prolixibacteraceae bacterium]HCU61350.1 uridine kinase [Prolixibacteraceae bacterium]